MYSEMRQSANMMQQWFYRVGNKESVSSAEQGAFDQTS